MTCSFVNKTTEKISVCVSQKIYNCDAGRTVKVEMPSGSFVSISPVECEPLYVLRKFDVISKPFDLLLVRHCYASLATVFNITSTESAEKIIVEKINLPEYKRFWGVKGHFESFKVIPQRSILSQTKYYFCNQKDISKLISAHFMPLISMLGTTLVMFIVGVLMFVWKTSDYVSTLGGVFLVVLSLFLAKVEILDCFCFFSHIKKTELWE